MPCRERMTAVGVVSGTVYARPSHGGIEVFGAYEKFRIAGMAARGGTLAGWRRLA